MTIEVNRYSPGDRLWLYNIMRVADIQRFGNPVSLIFSGNIGDSTLDSDSTVS